MSYNQKLSSPARVRALQLMADKGRPLSIREMTDWLDEPYHTVRYALARAWAAGWVVRVGDAPGTGSQLYRNMITDAGRVWLAEQKVPTKEPS